MALLGSPRLVAGFTVVWFEQILVLTIFWGPYNCKSRLCSVLKACVLTTAVIITMILRRIPIIMIIILVPVYACVVSAGGSSGRVASWETVTIVVIRTVFR